jgi:hypothetical protein
MKNMENMKKVSSIFAIIAVMATLSGCIATREQGDDVDSSNTNPAPAITQADCFNDTVLFEVPSTNVKFCYKEAWGAPVVSAPIAGTTGTKVAITFGNSGVVTPVLFYSTVDFERTSDDDSGFLPFDFDSIEPVLPEENLTADFATAMGLSGEDFSLTKVSVSGKRGIRVHYLDTDILSYYIPDAFEGYNFEISGSSKELALEIDDMAQWMISF